MTHRDKATTETTAQLPEAVLRQNHLEGYEGHQESENRSEPRSPHGHSGQEDCSHRHHQQHHREREEVQITINTVQRQICPGRHTVVQIKSLGGVSLADDLDEVIKGKLTPLADEGSVEISGGEVFLSHPKDGGSSGH